jgi:hypothetical protein
MPGVLVLELYRAQISECGMEPACVVDRVDEARKIGGDILKGFVGHQVHRLDLQCFHEALRLGGIVWIAAPAHRADEAVIAEELAVDLRGVLRSAVGMMHAPFRRVTRPNGGFERGECEPGVDRAADRVADHATRPGVEDHRQIDEANSDCDIGDVRHP